MPIRNYLLSGSEVHAAKEDDPEEAKQEGVELFDIRPMTVGLVQRGANRRSFFLAKSADALEGGTMPGQTETTGDEELDAIRRIENAAAEDDELDAEDTEDTQDAGADEATEGEPEDKKKKKSSTKAVLESISDALMMISNRRQRDPIMAAQRALGAIGGHPELMSAAKILMDFLEAARKKGPQQPQGGDEAQYGYGYPAPMAGPKAKPQKKAEEEGTGEHDKGQFSLTEKSAGEAEEGADMPGQIDPATLNAIQAAVAAAIEPLKRKQEEQEGKLGNVEQAIAQSAARSEASEMVPLVKSTGLTPEQLVALKKTMKEEDFGKLTKDLGRYVRLAKSANAFGEIGTSQGAEPATDETLIEKKVAELRKDRPQLDPAQALIEASAILGLGLGEAPTLGGED